MAMCESGRECANVKADCAEWRTKALDVEHHPVAELARERAMRTSAGCRCAALASDLPPSHVAGCPAMEGSRLRSERAFWRDRAHAMLAAARESIACLYGTPNTIGNTTYYASARDVLDAVEDAYREPEQRKEPT